jgi:cytochrome c
MKNVCVALVVCVACSLAFSLSCGSKAEEETGAAQKEVVTKPPAQEEMQEETGMAHGDVAKGKALFEDTGLGTNGKSCASCHPGGEGLAGVAAEYPVKDPETGETRELSDTINACITANLEGKALDPQSSEMKSLEAYLNTL